MGLDSDLAALWGAYVRTWGDVMEVHAKIEYWRGDEQNLLELSNEGDHVRLINPDKLLFEGAITIDRSDLIAALCSLDVVA